MPTPSPLVSSLGRHSLRLHGDFLLLMRPAHYLSSDSTFVRLQLHVSAPPMSLMRPPHDSRWYPPIELPLNQLSELRHRIRFAIPLYDQLVIGAGVDYDVFRFLTDLVNVYVVDSMEGRLGLPVPEHTVPVYRIRAYLQVQGQAAFAPPATIPFMLRKATYRNSNGGSEKSDVEDEAAAAAAAQILEASCPICLQDFEDGEEVNLTPCRHAFHPHCLQRWLQRKAQCPLCRSNIPHRL